MKINYDTPELECKFDHETIFNTTSLDLYNGQIYTLKSRLFQYWCKGGGRTTFVFKLHDSQKDLVDIHLDYSHHAIKDDGSDSSLVFHALPVFKLVGENVPIVKSPPSTITHTRRDGMELSGLDQFVEENGFHRIYDECVWKVWEDFLWRASGKKHEYWTIDNVVKTYLDKDLPDTILDLDSSSSSSSSNSDEPQ